MRDNTAVYGSGAVEDMASEPRITVVVGEGTEHSLVTSSVVIASLGSWPPPMVTPTPRGYIILLCHQASIPS